MIADESLVLSRDLGNRLSSYRCRTRFGHTPNHTRPLVAVFTQVERIRVTSGMVVECIYTGVTANQPNDEAPDRDEMIAERLCRSRSFLKTKCHLYSHQDADLHHLVRRPPQQRE